MAQPYYSDQLLQALEFLGEPVFGEPGSTRSVPGKQGSRPDAKPAAKATTGTKPDRTVTGKGRGIVPISYDQSATLAPISVRVTPPADAASIDCDAATEANLDVSVEVAQIPGLRPRRWPKRLAWAAALGALGLGAWVWWVGMYQATAYARYRYESEVAPAARTTEVERAAR